MRSREEVIADMIDTCRKVVEDTKQVMSWLCPYWYDFTFNECDSDCKPAVRHLCELLREDK